MKPVIPLLLFTGSLLAAVQIPAGTELNIRLTDKVASETATAHTAIHAVLVTPVALNGKLVLPLGTPLAGEIVAAKAAADQVQATLQLNFTQIGEGAGKAKLQAVVSGLDNARETVSADGVITGIDASKAYGAQLDQGITKLRGNQRLSALGGILDAAKQALKIEAVNANIDYDAGVELTLKLTAPLDWRGPNTGPETKLVDFPDLNALTQLVNRQPFRTIAEKPPKPSDITSLMLIGTDAQIRAAFEKAGWSTAARLSSQSKLETARALIEDRGYKEGPMSILLLDGQPPAFMYQKGNNTFAARHHLRIFARPETFAGQPVWLVSATHDTGIDFSERDRTFIHKIDSNIDLERAKIVSDLLYAGALRSVALVDRPALPTGLSNATGDAIQTDGRMAVLLLQ